MIPLLLIWGIGSEHNGYLVNWRNWGHQDILLSGMPGLGWPLPFLPLTFGFVPTGSGFLDSSGNPMKVMPFLSLRTRGQLCCVWWSRCSTWPWALDGSRSRVPLAISGTTRGFQTQVFGWWDCGQGCGTQCAGYWSQHWWLQGFLPGYPCKADRSLSL